MFIHLNAIDFGDSGKVNCTHVGQSVSKVEGGETDVEDKYEDLVEGFVAGGSGLGRGRVTGDRLGLLLKLVVLVGVLVCGGLELHCSWLRI
jgi:hypothetical protein